MNVEMQNLKCPNCGGTMEIDHEQHMLICPYCDRTVLIKEDKQMEQGVPDNNKTLLIIISLVLITIVVIVCLFAGSNRPKLQEYDWPSTGPAVELPRPYSPYGKITHNDNSSFSITVFEASMDDYNTYVERCKEKGFDVEQKEEWDYSAFNEEGYFLRVQFLSDKEQLSISIQSPVKLSPIDWTSIENVSFLPQPESDLGRIIMESYDYTEVYIGDTTIDDYNEYVKSCQKAGFNRNMVQNESFFLADHKESDWHLHVKYIGFEVMKISVSLD